MMIINVVFLVLTTLVAGAAAYLGAYWREKGKNLATHQDIDKLVDQVAAVTQATKEIEAKISSEMWDRQKRWELKTQAVFEAMKRVMALKDAVAKMQGVYNTDKQAGTSRTRRANNSLQSG